MGSTWLANSCLTWRQLLVWRVRGRLLFISTTICQSFAAIFLRPQQRAGWQHSVQLPRSSKRRVGLHLALSGARGTSGSGAATRASFTSVKKRVRHKFGADSTKQRSTHPKNCYAFETIWFKIHIFGRYWWRRWSQLNLGRIFSHYRPNRTTIQWIWAKWVPAINQTQRGRSNDRKNITHKNHHFQWSSNSYRQMTTATPKPTTTITAAKPTTTQTVITSSGAATTALTKKFLRPNA